MLQSQKSLFSFRIATEADINQIVDLVELAYRGEESKKGWTTEAEFIDGQRTDQAEVEELMKLPDSVFILCFENKELVASLHIHKSSRKTYLGMFAVNPKRQAAGIGKLLLQQAEKYCQTEWGCDTVRMLVITIRTELISWYLRQGYLKTNIIKAFPYHEPRFGLPKRADLELEVLEKRFVD